jgi:hypothetical protein
MAEEYEPNRFLGFPVRTGPRTGPQAKRHEESQRVKGIPVDWFAKVAKVANGGSGANVGSGAKVGSVADGGSVDRDQVWPLAHPIRGYKRWLRRRRLGPYAVDEDQRH